MKRCRRPAVCFVGLSFAAVLAAFCGFTATTSSVPSASPPHAGAPASKSTAAYFVGYLRGYTLRQSGGNICSVYGHTRSYDYNAGIAAGYFQIPLQSAASASSPAPSP